MIKTENLMQTKVNSARKISSKRGVSRLLMFLTFALLAAISVVPRSHALTVTLDTTSDLLKVPPEVDYALSWTAVAPSTTDAKVYYYVYQEFGLDGVSFSTPGNHVAFTDEPSYLYEGYPGARCFRVVSSDTANGPAFSDGFCHDFIYSVDRKDGDDSQRNVGDNWEFTFALDVDAKLTSRIYPPGTQFTTDSNGFIIGASSASIRTLVDSAPRSGSIRGVTVTQEWDKRYSPDGIRVSSYVPNGIYYLLVQATLDSGQIVGSPPAESPALSSLETYLRSGRAFPIPIDLRIADIKATPITLTNTQSDITYFLTGNATVRVVIAKSNAAFNVTSAGAIEVYNSTGGVLDNSLLVSSFTYQRAYGENTEVWDGTSSTGTVMPKGNYLFAISAVDDYGNAAATSAGDDGLFVGVIPLERTVGSTAGSDDTSSTGDTSAPTVAAITVNGATFTDGQVFSGSVSTITVRLSDTSGISLGSSNISVVGPNSQTISGTLTNNGSDTMTFTFSTPQAANGTYTITITAVDALGNSATSTSLTRGVETFTILVQLNQGEFDAGTKVYPNPAKNVSQVTISYTLNVASSVEIEIFNILGEKVYSTTTSGTASTNTFPWNLKNGSGNKVGSGLYLVRIKATGGGVAVETTKKLVVIQ